MKRLSLLFALLISLHQPLQAEPMKVASLHPLISDLVQKVGGSHVQVISIIKPGADIHHFEPSGKDIAAMKNTRMLFASGKHLESYLEKLSDSLGASVKVVEVGKLVPSVVLNPDQAIFVCCPAHAKNGIDPHWWHSADSMKRAARIVADALSEVDPANESAYDAGGKTAAAEFDSLKKWAQQQISAIPRENRKLVTAHAAFGYFCKEYGFKSVPILGLSRESETSPQYLATAIQVIRENKIRAVFPEDQANPKVLTEIVRDTGVKIGRELIADGTSPQAHTFETMLRHNVTAIVEALK
jgi:zinc/manganese transport system substrate-binding protein